MPAWSAPWNGVVKSAIAGEDSQSYNISIPDDGKPVRAAMIFNAYVTYENLPNWRKVAAEFNCVMIDFGYLVPQPTLSGGDSRPMRLLDYRQGDKGGQRILALLTQLSKKIPSHPEIQYTGICLYGFSVTSADNGYQAQKPILANRVVANVALHEIDNGQYLPLVSVPHLFLSSQGTDPYSPLLTNVEGANFTHDTLARCRRATGLNAPLTVVAHVGQFHGGDPDANIIGLWLQDVLSLRLPAAAPTTAPIVMPNWQNNSGWFGSYDVVLNTNTQPWGNEQRMTNVVIAAKAAYTDPRPYIWLPNQHFAEIWKNYATTGIMPAFTPMTGVAVPKPGADQSTIMKASADKLSFYTLLGRKIKNLDVPADRLKTLLSGAPLQERSGTPPGLYIIKADRVMIGKTVVR
ncbi:MAG: hypothetical protein PHC61_15530 [Chitinivibrionales bacterium]|nr:hypothetical protein [Chitinivibrionales bacterium]